MPRCALYMFPNVLVQVRRSFVKLAAGDRRAGEIDAAANNQIDVGDGGRCGGLDATTRFQAEWPEAGGRERDGRA